MPCGHNFCKRCIGDHWHKQKEATEASYTCPECRRSFERCPELEKNVTLYSVVELARDSEARGSVAGRGSVAPGELCRQHGRPLELFCEDERRCICCVCTVRDCQRHRRVLFEEERAKKQVGDRAGVSGKRGGVVTAQARTTSACSAPCPLCVPGCPPSAGHGAGQGVPPVPGCSLRNQVGKSTARSVFVTL